MESLSIDSLTKLKEKLPELRDQALYKLDDIYLYAFHFLKDTAEQRLISLNGVLMMIVTWTDLIPGALATIDILLGHFPHTKRFIEFMKNHQTTYKGMNADQWSMFLTFSKTVDIDFGA